jgi:hypothetical protein
MLKRVHGSVTSLPSPGRDDASLNARAIASTHRYRVRKEDAVKSWWLTAASLFAVMACTASATDEEESVYRGYLAQFRMIDSFADRGFEKYLSSTARGKLAEALARRASRSCSPCPSEQQELDLAKAMRPYPPADLRPTKSFSDGRVTLNFSWHEPAGNGAGINGSDIIVVVEVIKEAGAWKLKSESWRMVETAGTSRSSGASAWSY